MNFNHLGKGLALCLALLISQATAAQISLTKVANLDDPADGTVGMFIDFLEGYLNDSAEVLIEATSTGSLKGLWTGTVGMTLDLVGVEGDTIPSPGGASYDAVWYSPLLAGNGDVFFRNRLGNPDNGGYFSYPASGPTATVALPGDAAPGTTAFFEKFASGHGEALNDLGEYVYWAATDEPNVTLDAGFWNSAGLLIQEGDTTSISGVIYAELNDEVAMNDSGEIVFSSKLQVVPAATREALFAGDPAGPPAVVVRRGDDAVALAPSLPPGTVFDIPNSGSINDSGAVSFRSTLSGPSIVTGVNNVSIWTNSGGPTVMLGLRGDAAIGFPAGNIYEDFDQPIICDNGDVIFHATLATPPATLSTNEALYRFTPGSGVALIAREGGAAPGTAGAMFSTINTYAVSDGGRVAFRGNLTGGDATASLNHGLWIDENDGMGPVLVARESDTFKVDLINKTLGDVTLSKRVDGGSGGRPSALPSSNVLMKIAYSGGGKGYFVFGPPPFEFIAATGMVAPGTGGMVYDSIRPVATIAADGRTIFRAWVADFTPPKDQQGIWYEEPGVLPTDPFVLTKMARQGDPVPGLGGPVWQNMTRLPAWNDTGDAAFFGSIRYDAGFGIDKWNTFGVWYDPAGSGLPGLLIRGSDSAIMGASITSAEVFEVSRRAPPINSAGHVPYTLLFRMQEPLQSPPPPPPFGSITKDNNSAIGVFDGLTNHIVAQEGVTSSLSTVNPGAVFDYLLNNSELFISDDGTFIFEGLLRIGSGFPAVTAATESGIWVANSSGLLLKALAQGGMAAPGTGGDYLTPVKAALSRKPVGPGTPAVFRSNLTGVPAANNIALFYTADAVLTAPTAIAQRGIGLAPGTGVSFADFVHPMMSDDGHIGFRAELTGGGTGLWSSLGSPPTPTPTLSLEMLSGDPAPDVPGATFESFEPPIVGDGEQFAFVGHMAIGPGGVTAADNTGLWVRNPAGAFTLLIREGTSLSLPTAAIVTVSDIDIGGYNKESHRPQQMVAINAAGQFVFWLEFLTGESAAVRVQL